MINFLKILEKKKLIRPIDFYFSKLISHGNNIIMLAAACISFESSNNHIFLPIEYFEKKNFFSIKKKSIIQKIINILNKKKIDWSLELLNHKACSNGSQITPLVLFKKKLYLYKIWNAEKKIFKYLNKDTINKNIDIEVFSKILNILFPKKTCHLQKISVALTLIYNIIFITGGPGTGKTSLIIKIIIAIIKTSKKKIKIKLSAPTGKAVARLKEILNNKFLRNNLSEIEKEQISFNPVTIHKLLKISKIPNVDIFCDKKIILLDVLIIDETSMIDILMMYNILSSISDSTKVIFIGDQDQLKPVELGSIFKNICHYSNNKYSSTVKEILEKIIKYSELKKNTNKEYYYISNRICTLKKNYRFKKTSGIYILSNKINENKKEIFKKLFNNSLENVFFQEHNSVKKYENMINKIIEKTQKYWEIISNKDTIINIIKKFQEHQVLCAIKNSIFGVKFINKILEEKMYKKKMIRKYIFIDNDIWYVGKPIIVTKNNKLLNISNGDIGIVNINKKKFFQVSFLGYNREIKNIPINFLKNYDTAWAITVHKAQGSEFNYTTLILPDKNLSILDKNIIYTAITRSKKIINIFSTKKIFMKILSNTNEKILK